MPFDSKKTAKFLQRSLILIPTAYQSYDANHISIVFFAVLGLKLLREPVPPEIADYVDQLFVGCGYKGSVTYPSSPSSAHLPSTYFGLGLRLMLDMPPHSAEEIAAMREFIPQCQLPSGVFRSRIGEGDVSVRHSYTAHAVRRLLDDMSATPISNDDWIAKSVAYISSCQNYEGGMGDSVEQESHLGLTYCAVAALKLQDQTNCIPHHQRLLTFLAKRELTSGGSNGRPNKPADVCYSFWLFGTLKTLGLAVGASLRDKAVQFLTTKGADDMLGGFWKTPNTVADPYHTALALCALSLLDGDTLNLAELDPVLCLPTSCLSGLLQ